MEGKHEGCFISNYINHHQIPFSNALYEQLGTITISSRPSRWKKNGLRWAGDWMRRLCHMLFGRIGRKNAAGRLIEEADLVFAGWTKRLDLVLPRLSSGKLTFQVSERIYREGQWKAISLEGACKI